MPVEPLVCSEVGWPVARGRRSLQEQRQRHGQQKAGWLQVRLQ